MNFPVSLRRESAKRVGTGRLMVTMGFASTDIGWDPIAREQRGIQTHQQTPTWADTTHKDLRGART